MNSEYAEWTAGHVVDFHEWAGNEGRMNASTAATRGSAVKRVFEYVYGEEEWPKQSVKDLDTEDLFLRFRNKAKFDLTPKSMETYEGRFVKAVESYVLFNEDQTAWAQSLRAIARAPRTSKSEKKADKKKADEPKKDAATDGESSTDVTPPAAGLVQYPFPVRQGLIAQLHLPADLRKKEAARLSAFLDSLAIDEQPALNAGRNEGE